MTSEHLASTVIAFCCENSGLPAVEDARYAGAAVPECVQVVRVPCAGKVDEDHVLKALEAGAAGAVILGCHTDSCQYVQGNVRAEKRLARLRGLLEEVGYPPETLVYAPAAPAEAARVARLLRDCAAELVAPREEAMET